MYTDSDGEERKRKMEWPSLFKRSKKLARFQVRSTREESGRKR